MSNTTFVLFYAVLFGPLFTFLLTAHYYQLKHSREMSAVHKKNWDAETERQIRERAKSEQQRQRDREERLKQQAQTLHSNYERRVQELEQWKLTVDERLPPLSGQG